MKFAGFMRAGDCALWGLRRAGLPEANPIRLCRRRVAGAPGMVHSVDRRPMRAAALAQQSVETLKRCAQDISVETLCGVSINAIFLVGTRVVVATGEETLAVPSAAVAVTGNGWALIWWFALLMKQGRSARQSGRRRKVWRFLNG